MVGHRLAKKLSNQYEIFSLLRKRPDLDSNQFFEKVLPKNQCIFIDDIKVGFLTRDFIYIIRILLGNYPFWRLNFYYFRSICGLF